MNLTLRRPARVARVVDHLVQREKVVEPICVFIVANNLDHAARNALRAGRRVNPPVRSDRYGPTRVRVRMSGKRIEAGWVSIFARVLDWLRVRRSRASNSRPGQPGSRRARTAHQEVTSFQLHAASLRKRALRHNKKGAARKSRARKLLNPQPLKAPPWSPDRSTARVPPTRWPPPAPTCSTRSAKDRARFSPCSRRGPRN